MNQKYLKMRELCRLLVKMQGDHTRTALRLYSRLVVINPEFTRYFSNPLCKSGLFILERYPAPHDLSLENPDDLQKRSEEHTSELQSH